MGEKMKLTDLYPEFISIVDEKSHKRVETLGEADGIKFLCPYHMRDNGMDPTGVHSVIIWRPKISFKIRSGSGRWEFSGTNFSNLTIGWFGYSIVLDTPLKEEFWIDRGTIVFPGSLKETTKKEENMGGKMWFVGEILEDRIRVISKLFDDETKCRKFYDMCHVEYNSKLVICETIYG
jgi:hypothetical protein